MIKYQDLPNELSLFINELIESNIKHRLLDALNENEDQVINAINYQLSEASMITGLTFHELLKSCDFDRRDHDANRFDAMFAEIRSIIFLNQIGFSKIQPLKAPKAKREADMTANYKDTKWAIEVMCSSYLNQRWTESELTEYINRRFSEDKKGDQLKISSEKHSCNKQLLVIVINSPAAKALNNRNDYLNVLKYSWETLNLNCDQHLAIVTGMQTLGSGTDDCIYPQFN